MQAVPTSVVEGPDGHYYVGQLTGFPFPVGGANIFRVNPRTGSLRACSRAGFTNIMDLAFGRDGTLYVLEIDHDSLLGPGNEGAIFAVDRRGTRRIELPAGTLPEPGGHRRRQGRPLRHDRTPPRPAAGRSCASDASPLGDG